MLALIADLRKSCLQLCQLRLLTTDDAAQLPQLLLHHLNHGQVQAALPSAVLVAQLLLALLQLSPRVPLLLEELLGVTRGPRSDVRNLGRLKRRSTRN